MPAVNRRKALVQQLAAPEHAYNGQWEMSMAYGHHARIFDVCYSRKEDQTFASASEDGSVRLWQSVRGTNTYQQRGCLTAESDAVLRVSWSPDERLLASGNSDGTVRLWDTSCLQTGSYGGSQVGVLRGSPEEVYTCDFVELPQRSAGSTLMSCSGSDLLVWDLTASTLLHTVALKPEPEGSPRFLFGCCQQPGSSSLASISSDGSVQLWDLSSAAPRLRIDRHMISGIGSALAFSSDGTKLACTSRDGSVVVLEVRSMRVLAQCDLGCPGLSCCFVRHKGAETLAVVGGDANVHLLNLLGGEGEIEECLSPPPAWGDVPLLVVTTAPGETPCIAAAGETSGMPDSMRSAFNGEAGMHTPGTSCADQEDDDELFCDTLSDAFPTRRRASHHADGEGQEGEGGADLIADDGLLRAPIFMWSWKS